MSYFQSPRKEIHLIFMGVFCSHCIGKDHFIARIIKLPFEMARTITKIMSDASVSLWVYLRWVTYASQVPDEPHRASAGRCTSWGTCSHAIIHSDCREVLQMGCRACFRVGGDVLAASVGCWSGCQFLSSVSGVMWALRHPRDFNFPLFCLWNLWNFCLSTLLLALLSSLLSVTIGDADVNPSAEYIFTDCHCEGSPGKHFYVCRPKDKQYLRPRLTEKRRTHVSSGAF